MSLANSQYSIVARRYASALFEVARRHDSIDSISSSLNVFRDVFAQPGFKQIISGLSLRDQIAFVRRILEKNHFHDHVVSFIMLLAKKKRLFFLEAIVDSFKRKINSHRGILRIDVQFATDPNDAHICSLKEAMLNFTRKHNRDKHINSLDLFVKVDRNLIGGMIIAVDGGVVIDTSIKNKLIKMAQQLKEVR